MQSHPRKKINHAVVPTRNRGFSFSTVQTEEFNRRRIPDKNTKQRRKKRNHLTHQPVSPLILQTPLSSQWSSIQIQQPTLHFPVTYMNQLFIISCSIDGKAPLQGRLKGLSFFTGKFIIDSEGSNKPEMWDTYLLSTVVNVLLNFTVHPFLLYKKQSCV